MTKGSFSDSFFTKVQGRAGHYSFFWLAPLILDPYLIMLSVMQGGIKYHFWVFVWLDLGLNSSLLDHYEHLDLYANGPLIIYLYIYIYTHTIYIYTFILYIYIYIYIYITAYWPSRWSVHPEDQSSTPGWVISKTHKMEVDTYLLNF